MIVIRKTRVKSRRRQTGSSCVLWPTFGQIECRGRCVGKTGLRHISTSGLASRAPGGSFLPYSGPYGCSIADSRFEMLPTTKSAASGLNMWPRSTTQIPEVLTNVPEMVRNVVKLTIIRKTRVKRRSGCGDAFPIEGVLVATYLLSVKALPHCRCEAAN